MLIVNTLQILHMHLDLLSNVNQISDVLRSESVDRCLVNEIASRYEFSSAFCFAGFLLKEKRHRSRQLNEAIKPHNNIGKGAYRSRLGSV